MKENKIFNKKHFPAYLILLACGFIFLGTSYAWFVKTDYLKDFQIVVNDLTYTLASDALNSSNQVTVAAGETLAFDILVTSNNPVDTKYQMVYSSSNDLTSVEVGYNTLTVDASSGTIEKNASKTISVVVINNKTESVTIQFNVRGGLKNNEVSDIILASADTRLETGIENICTTLNETGPNAPQLTSGMIAVTYSETEKTWVKADSTKTDWYDYSNQIWANAVTVTEETRATYMDLAVGEPISMDDINTMWVWIPRYSYTIMQPYGRTEKKCSELGEITIDSPENCRKLDYPDELRQEALDVCKNGYDGVTTEEECVQKESYDYSIKTFEDVIDLYISWGDLEEDTRTVIETYPDNYASGTKTLPEAIDIRFISAGEKDTGTGQCEQCAENWVTPEGFTFGGEELSGFWMAKFETSTLETCTAANNVVDTGCDLTTFALQVKPNVTSWTGARVSTFFETSRLMQSSENASKYGFTTEEKGTMDVHMLKNTEWGIVAMFSQSKYGKYGNPSYEGANKEIYQNKSSSYITGMSNGTPSQEQTNTQVTYDTPDTGYGASTTGTIYGVYDMSGGAWEKVMGNYNNISGSSTTYNSGFSGTNGPTTGGREWPNIKYYDLYTSNIASVAYKIGDATFETGGWYGDNAYFVESDYLWFVRGGAWNHYTLTGAFTTSNNNGESNTYDAFRLAIKP